MLLLCLFCNAALAQTQIRKNPASPTDSIVVELPHNIKMILVLDDLNKLNLLEKTSLDSLVKTLNTQLKESNGIAPATSTPAQQVITESTDTTKSTDQLVIWASVGAGLIRQDFVPQFSPGLEVRLKDKAYFVNYDMNFFFDRTPENKHRMHVNSFVDVGFGFRKFAPFGINNSGETENFRRISVGYLVQSNGGYFEKNTFRLSYSYPILNNMIKVMPQLYITNNLKTFFPGVSLRF